jgi:alkaline phosphatase
MYLMACGFAQIQAQCQARNVILVIGDGMGLAQVSYLINSVDEPNILEQFQVVGLQKTHSATNLMTDSGAAATAISCGQKTYNNAIGMAIDTTPCETLFETAKAHGRRTGIVVTSSVVHATPASFVAHQKLRGFHEAIAEDIVRADLDYLVGGGMLYFTNRYSDNRNLIKEMNDDGCVVSSYDRKSFKAFAKRVAPRMAYFSAYTEPVPKMQGRENLSEMVTHAIQVLNAPKSPGFILMVEASQIDYALHGNDASYLLTELKDLFDALKVVYEFASGRDDTVVIVTGDHETGSLSIGESIPGKKVRVDFMSRNHSHLMVPVFALGPCSELFAGIYENTTIHDKILQATAMSQQ